MKNLIIFFLLLSSVSLTSQQLELLTGTPLIGYGIGASRDLSFEALSDFSISSIGFYADLLNESFEVNIYPSTDGNDVSGPALASATSVLGGSGLMYYDMPIDFSFDAGNFYVIQWKPTDNGFSDWVGPGEYGYMLDSNLPFDLPPVRIIMGFQNLGVGNVWHPQFRINIEAAAIPTLSQWGLMILGLSVLIIGLVAFRQIRNYQLS